VARAYGGETRLFGKDSLIPAPFDPRLILRIAPAVAKAAMESGVATRPIADLEAYAETLMPLRVPLRLRHEAGLRCRQEGSEARDLCRRRGRARAARGQVVLEEGIAKPILIGRPR
jgi:malate dehydrogenase (oxaloacetate-decarboxylating)(NADP+)